jgi:hypothetical protein
MKETTELGVWIAQTFGILFSKLRDGFQPGEDLLALLPQLITATPAFSGLQALDDEAAKADVQGVDDLFAAMATQLVSGGMKPLVANAITSGLKAGYLAYCASLQRPVTETSWIAPEEATDVA